MSIYGVLGVEEPPEIQHHFSWYRTGVGICGRCNDVRTLVLHSAVHRDNLAEPTCFFCTRDMLANLLNQTDLSESDSQEAYRIFRRVYQDFVDDESRILHTRQEILAHEWGCQACAKFFHPEHIRDYLKPVQAIHPIEGTTHTVHRSCSSVCSDCDKRLMLSYITDDYTFPRRALFYDVHGVGAVCVSCSDKYKDWDRCHRCECIVCPDEMREAWGSWYCPDCHSLIYNCEYCGEDYWDDDGHECDEREQSRVIRSYDFRPRGGFRFHGQDEHNLFMGFELEVEGGDDTDIEYSASEALSVLEGEHERGFIKSDGSLNNGFEIVTQPHTLEEYMDKFPWEVITNLQHDGFRSWNTSTCGLHIHVSRSAFGWNFNSSRQTGRTEAHALRFLKLIYDNQAPITRLAGRTSDQWASFADRGYLLRKVKHNEQNNGRYSAVNLGNRDTFEIRIFRGTMRVERIKAQLQFVHSAVEYTRDLKVSPANNTLRWGAYRKWLHAHNDKYPQLVTLLNTLSSNETESN